MARSSSRSSSSSSSGSDSEDSDDRRRREKKEKKRKREREARKDEKRHRKKEKKKSSSKHKHDKHKHKKHKRDKEGGGSSSMAGGGGGGGGGLYGKWGQYGIIRESDMPEKQEEFLAWLSEHKGVNQEALRPWELKEHFSSYVEDFNTATLPHEKYYNMRTWYMKDLERKQREGAQEAAEQQSAGFVRTTFDDEAERKREMLRERERRAQEITKVMAESMKRAGADSSLVQDMREQEEKKLAMRSSYAVGDVSKARDMAQKLDPKYVSAEELKKVFGGPAPLNSKKPGGMGSGH